MTKTITNTMMRNKLKQITSDGYSGASGIEATTGKTKVVHSTGTVKYVDAGTNTNSTSITEIKYMNFNKIRDNTTIIFNDGSEATIINPLPNVSFSCLATPDSDGVMTLTTYLTATLLVLNDKQYCLGISGNISNQIELKVKCKNNEIRINENYINIKADTLILNGLEYEAKQS